MTSFEGNFRPNRRPVFDRTEKQTKETILKNVFDKRQERQLNTRRNEAVIKLQACFRGTISRAKLLEIATITIEELAGFLKTQFENQQDVMSMSKSELAGLDRTLVRLLRLLSWRHRQKPDKHFLFIACNLLLSNMGRTCTSSWLSQEPIDRVYALGRILVVLSRYLSELPPQSPSSDYFVPVRLLESLLAHQNDATADQKRLHLMWLYMFLAKNHYFRYMCQFIDRNVPSTAGYLPTEDTAQPFIFDPVEFVKPVRTQTLLALLICPLSWYLALVDSTYSQNQMFEDEEGSPSSPVKQLYELVAVALNDILLPDSDWYTPNERIVRGMAGHLLDRLPPLPVLHYFCSALLSPPDSLSTASSGGSSVMRSRKAVKTPTYPLPSVNLLYLLINVVAPRFIKVKSTANPAGHIPSHECQLSLTSGADEKASDLYQPFHASVSLPTASSSVGSLEAALFVRCIADLLVRAMFTPGLPCTHPLTDIKPLLWPDEELADLSDDEASGDGSFEAAGQKSLWSKPTWKGQTEELFAGLQQCLPALASGALTVFNTVEVPNSLSPTNWLTSSQRHLVTSLAQLHYIFAHIFRLTSTAMIVLNTTYSQHPIFIRALWHVIQYSRHPSASPAISNSSLFTLLATGELPKHISSLQTYLPLVFTFSDCLFHRLLCLTDIEISNGMLNSRNPPSQNQSERFALGCGFTGDELLAIGLRLRDLAVGIINLAHPYRLEKRSTEGTYEWCNTQVTPTINTDQTSNVESVSSFSEVFESIERRTEGTRNMSGWSIADLRIQLHCWISLFRHVQRLVFQIYYWHRRTDHHKALHSSVAPSLESTGSQPEYMDTDYSEQQPTPSWCSTTDVWLKPMSTTSILTSLNSLVNSHDSLSTLASAPFGYYSRLNPDITDITAMALSRREVCDLLVMKELPFIIPLSGRVRLFRLLVNPTRSARTGWATADFSENIPIVVRRSHLYEDAFEKLSKENEPNLKARIRVGFVNPAGVEEMGIDGGGLSREFLIDLLRTGFDPNRGLFVSTTEQTLYPNPQVTHIFPDYQKHYYFLGRILGKAIYEEIQVELRFAHFFLAKLVSRAGAAVGFDYLQSLDPELYRQLNKLKSYDGDFGALALDFTIVQSAFGQSETVELKPGGQHIAVNEENRVEYMHLVAHYKLNRQIHQQVRAFLAGVNDVISTSWFRLFDAEEMQWLISGSNKIDVEDLRRHTKYLQDSEKYTETLTHFWGVLDDLSEDDKRLFLRFVTSCSSPPVFGFENLQPPFTIQITDELDRLPTASTCSNLLRLPDYKDPEVIREKLLFVIKSNAGFEYS